MTSLFKWKRHYWVLILILAIGLVLRTIRLDELYEYGHDNDLYSFFVKDVVIDKHLRLIGQQTSYDGVFIGPLFYYLLIPFFLLANFDPIGATWLAVMVAMLTIVSIYWVLRRLYSTELGLISAGIYSLSLGNVFFDRWVVPTQLTLLWSIWFLYGIVSLWRKKQSGFVVIGLMVGLIWHVHIALLPLVLLPIGVIAWKRIWPERKTLLWTLVAFGGITLPFWIFELRHGFIQTVSLFAGFGKDKPVVDGWTRMLRIFDNAQFAARANLLTTRLAWWSSGIMLPIYLVVLWKKWLARGELGLLAIWAGLLLFGNFISNQGISEYYFLSLTVVTLMLVGLILTKVWTWPWGKYIVVGIMGVLLWSSGNEVMNRPPQFYGYYAKNKLIDYVIQDAKEHGHECVAFNYITPPGFQFGWRYLFWQAGLKVVRPSGNAPIYNIVYPRDVSGDEVDVSFEGAGLILPENRNVVPGWCDSKEAELDELWGLPM